MSGDRPFGFYGKFTATPGSRAALVAVLTKAADAMRLVEGCRLYIVNEDLEDESVIWVTELWDSTESHSSSLLGEGVADLIALAKPLLAGRVEQVRLAPVAGKGL